MKSAIAFSKTPNRNWSFYAGLIAVLLIITVIITVSYIVSQSTFLGGDINDGFYQFTLQVTDTFRQSPLAALQLIHQSFARDYNKFFTLPLIPFVLVFGNSYLAYVISVAIVYLLPFLLFIGAIATHLVPIYPRAVFASTTLISAFITPNWVTIFQGYPDISAALIIVLIIWICLQGVYRNFIWLFPYRWQIPILGFLFAVTILLRRHFAYAVIAVLGAICIYTAVVFALQVQQNSRLAWRNLGQFGLQISLILATCLVTLLLLAWEFTLRAFTEDYVSLYDSWSRPWQDVFSFYSALYGWSIWLLAIGGFVSGVVLRTLSLPSTLLISTFGVISMGLWLFRLRYTETYYALHFAPFILLGLSAFVWTIGLKLTRTKRALTLALFSIVLAINAVFGITFWGSHSSSMRPWLAASYPPPVRSDYNQVIQVVDLLRQLAPNQEPIFVVYTAYFPMHLLGAAEETVYGKEGKILNLKQGSPTDSDGFYPLPDLLKADYVVVTQPFVGWNEPEQRIVKAVFDTFTQAQEFTQDFERLPQQFKLQGNAVVTIYRRVQPTPVDRAVRTLQALQTQVDKPLGKQLDWIPLDRSPDSSVKQNRKNKQRLTISTMLSASGQVSDQVSNQNNLTSFLYLGELPERAEIKGRAILSKSCTAVTLTALALNQQGQVIHPPQTQQLAQTTNLQLQLDSVGASYLLLQASQSPPESNKTEPCRLKIGNIQVSSAPD